MLGELVEDDTYVFLFLSFRLFFFGCVCVSNILSGCIFLSEIGLIDWDHPFNEVRGITREDLDGNISAILFQVDLFTRLYSIARRGGAANWVGLTAVKGE